jgi:hypothetical protein
VNGLEWRIVTGYEQEERCEARPSKRSSARCEMPKDHKGVTLAAEFHCGRTRRGYWKSWPVSEGAQ